MDETFRQEQHRGWGNSIEWFTKPHEIRVGVLRKRKVLGELVGWLRTHPKVGDEVATPMQSGRNAIFRVTSVKGVRDPMDMFYADVEFDRYEDEEPADG